jgi:hypothetical protein
MTRIQELISKAPEITVEESAAMTRRAARNQGLATAPSALFDQGDIVRLIMYRRAIRAGMYGDHFEERGLHFMADYPRPAPVINSGNGPTHWHDVPGAGAGVMRRCTVDH